jgi:two-component system sensor histidine kinase/response regulator
VQPLKKDTPSTVPNHTKPLARKDADETAKFLKQLLGFLENNNWQAEDCLSQIRLRLEDHNPAELAAIESHILNLEFDAAAALVKKLHNDLYTPL